jgi:hypothetical protein
MILFSSRKTSLRAMFSFLTPCLVSANTLGHEYQFILFRVFTSYRWFCDEGCRSSYRARCSRGAHHLHKFGENPGRSNRNLGEVLTFLYSEIASPEGLTTFCAKYPSLKVVCSRLFIIKFLECFQSPQVTGWIDQGLNEKAYIIPGLGDFGERRFAIHPSQILN